MLHRDAGKDSSIEEMFKAGLSMAEIGRRLSVSRERVRQRLKRIGYTANGFNPWLIKPPQTYKSAEWKAYKKQRENAKWRGIPFELTFEQWKLVWADRLPERGPNGLVMCRFGDKGPYAVGNVYIATPAQNCQDYWAHKRATTTSCVESS
jgi:hypothetical protein